MILANDTELFKDIIPESEDSDSETRLLKLQLKGAVKEDKMDAPKKDVGKYINKVGRSVMPSRKAEDIKDKTEQNEKR